MVWMWNAISFLKSSMSLLFRLPLLHSLGSSIFIIFSPKQSTFLCFTWQYQHSLLFSIGETFGFPFMSEFLITFLLMTPSFKPCIISGFTTDRWIFSFNHEKLARYSPHHHHLVWIIFLNSRSNLFIILHVGKSSDIWETITESDAISPTYSSVR